MTYKLMDILREVKDNPVILYHGTDKEHDFTNHGNLNKGSYLSYSLEAAKSHGKFIYKCILKSNLDIFDYTNEKNAKMVFQENDEIIDPYDESIIASYQELSNHSDIWEIVERQYMYGDDLFNQYGNDGIIVTEGGTLTVFLRYPVQDKLQNYERIK